MMRGLLDVEGGGAALPFVRMFYCSPSEYLWEDDEGTVHRIPQGERDALMPLLFAVGQHRALEASHRRMKPGEFLMAFHDDVYMATPPARVGAHARSGAGRTCLCTHASGCITGRLRCGTRLECVPLLATHWSALPGPTTPKLWCGRGPPSPQRSRGSRCWCRPVGVSEKGTRGFAQQNTVHQRCPERMVVACPMRFGTCVLLPQGTQTVSGGGIRTSSRRWFVAMLAEHPSVGLAPVFC